MAPRRSRTGLRLVAPLLLATGVGLLAYAVATGAASVALWAIVPVVSGRSGVFLAGVGLLLLGLLALPLSFAGPSPESGIPAPPPERAAAPEGAGGLLLLGPVPIFFGSWRSTPAWVRWAIALVVVGAMALLIVLALGPG